MEIVHSGFDSIYFAVQGALSPSALKRFESLKNTIPKTVRTSHFRLTIVTTAIFFKVQENEAAMPML